ncbi:hypothetical protein C8R45DRAFT_398446 [Mycena sanguinolenta]|nr:hypothetical protein C8R45DRAFT_398446 [Mycena sanguinolenta]
MASSGIDLVWSRMIMAFSETGVSMLFYGIYICLFLLSIHTLVRRRETHGIKLLMAWSCVIAVGGTTQIAINIAQAADSARVVHDLLHAKVSNSHGPALLSAQIALGAVNNFVTDSLFLYRCYVIWAYQWKITILPGLFLLSTFGMGIASARLTTGLVFTKPQFVYGLGVATNLILTALTVGRLLWLQRTTPCLAVDTKLRARCERAIGIVLESGAIYCIAEMLLLVTASFNAPEVYSVELGVASQLMNTISTFTLVYVGLSDTKPQNMEGKGNEHV